MLGVSYLQPIKSIISPLPLHLEKLAEGKIGPFLPAFRPASEQLNFNSFCPVEVDVPGCPSELRICEPTVRSVGLLFPFGDGIAVSLVVSPIGVPSIPSQTQMLFLLWCLSGHRRIVSTK